jgi:fatty acid desaturase
MSAHNDPIGEPWVIAPAIAELPVILMRRPVPEDFERRAPRVIAFAIVAVLSAGLWAAIAWAGVTLLSLVMPL